jgi:hypothetical protein
MEKHWNLSISRIETPSSKCMAELYLHRLAALASYLRWLDVLRIK